MCFALFFKVRFLAHIINSCSCCKYAYREQFRLFACLPACLPICLPARSLGPLLVCPFSLSMRFFYHMYKVASLNAFKRELLAEGFLGEPELPTLGLGASGLGELGYGSMQSRRKYAGRRAAPTLPEEVFRIHRGCLSRCGCRCANGPACTSSGNCCGEWPCSVQPMQDCAMRMPYC